MKGLDNTDYHAIWELFIATGNKEAIGKIYFSHYDLLYNFGLKYTNDHGIIEDAIQNIFGYFLKSRKLSPVKNLRGYLIQSFRHQLLLDLKKREKIFYLSNSEVVNNDCHQPEVNEIFEQEMSRRTLEKLDLCIENLTAKQKEIIYLRFQCELSYAEIARILDIAVDSCQKNVYRALKALREDFEKFGGVGHRLIMLFFPC